MGHFLGSSAVRKSDFFLTKARGRWSIQPKSRLNCETNLFQLEQTPSNPRFEMNLEVANFEIKF